MTANGSYPGTEVFIAGGGVAGAALGVHLARCGRQVEILEASQAMHHKVCGEFLSFEAVAALEQLGLDLRALGAVAIHGVRLHARTRIAACELPFAALSLSRRVLDEALLGLAERAGAAVSRGRRVESLERDGDGWRARLTRGEVRRARAAFLATGKHDLAGHRRPPGRQNGYVAFKMYFRLSPAQQSSLDGWVELYLFPGGYAGLQMVEEGRTNLCLVVERGTLMRCRNQWPALLAHLCHASGSLTERLDGAEPLLEKPLALSSIPYGMLPANSSDGLWRLGDQASVIPSLAGCGMAIALHSAQLACEVYTRGGSAAEYAQRLRRHLKGSVGLATAISRLICAAPNLAEVVRLWPGLLGVLAQRTRVPQDV
jgi:flavin-dependent dehydrogenase